MSFPVPGDCLSKGIKSKTGLMVAKAALRINNCVPRGGGGSKVTETSTPPHKKLELRGRASLSPLAVGSATRTISKRRIAPVMARMQASARHCENYQISCLVVTSYPTFQILSTSALNSTISDHGYRHLYPRASPSVLLHGILVHPS